MKRPFFFLFFISFQQGVNERIITCGLGYSETILGKSFSSDQERTTGNTTQGCPGASPLEPLCLLGLSDASRACLESWPS